MRGTDAVRRRDRPHSPARGRAPMTRTGLTAVLALSSAIGAGLAGCGGAPPVASLPPPEVSVSQPIERAGQPIRSSSPAASRPSRRWRCGRGCRATSPRSLSTPAPGEGRRPALRDRPARVPGRGRPRARARSPGCAPTSRARVAEVARTQRLRPSGAASEREMETRHRGSKGATEGELKPPGRPARRRPSSTSSSPASRPDRGARRAARRSPPATSWSWARTGGPLLTTIVSIDPIWVYFDIDEPSLLRLREAEHRRTGRPAHAGERRELADPGAARPRQREPAFPTRGGSTSSTTGSTRRPARCACARCCANAGPASSRPASSCACACRSANRSRRLLVTERADRHRSGSQVRAGRERQERRRVPRGEARPARGRAPRDRAAAWRRASG